MIDPGNDFETHVSARILDFLHAQTRWNRKLWNVGLSLTLREVLEAAGAVRVGTLSPASLDSLCGSAMKLVGKDPGAGNEEQRKVLQAALKTGERRGDRAPGLRPDVLDYHVIDQQETALSEVYLRRWAAALRGASPPGAERAARAIVSHLLDQGFSQDYLHKWWMYRIHHQEGLRPLADLVDEAHELARTPPRQENSERCDVVLESLDTVAANPGALAASDRAAVLRMLAVKTNPHKSLEDIRERATVAFRRLYRQRNLVLHTGKMDAIALRATLRTAAPLVGAGIDRIIHPYYVSQIDPLQLVARAKAALATVGTAGLSCTRLLDNAI